MTDDRTSIRTDLEQLGIIAEQFAAQRPVVDIQAFGNGNINDTFRVRVKSVSNPYFILQRINTQVFRQPEWVMQNMRVVTDHIRDRLQQEPLGKLLGDGLGSDLGGDRQWQMPQVLLTQSEQDHWIAPDGSFWRAISFIDHAQSFDIITTPTLGQEIGYALGLFHCLIADLAPERLADTLEGFHITPGYLQQFDRGMATCPVPQSPEVTYGLQFIRDRRAWATVLEDAKANGKLPLRPIHGDPKVNNVLIHTATQQAISIVDLDTVKPGLVHYDIGDCLRSGCNPVGEETEAWESVRFEPDLCASILQSYLAVAKAFFTENDYAYLYDAIRLIAFELGLRFFMDYLAGNVYFKVKHPEHNLARALVQFKLTESIETQEKTIRKLFNS
jgi:hypothetical protein